jgi:hypothetical protein
MTTPSERDERPWDLRFVEWMQRGGDGVPPPRRRGLRNWREWAILAVGYGIIGLVTGNSFFYPLAAVAAVISGGVFIRRRLASGSG